MSLKKIKPEDRKRIESVTFKIWSKLDHPHPKEIPLEDLAMSRGLLVLDGSMNNADGRLVRKNNRGIARIRKGITQEGRRRFTIAHELGHWELHQDQTQLFCAEEDLRDYGRSPLEVEANLFAAELLMPSHLFRDAIGKSEPSLQLIKDIAEEFQTTLTATAIRFADLSKHPVIVVWSAEGKIRWSYRNQERTSFYIVSGSKLPIYSSATLAKEELSSDMDHYDQANWFPQLPRDVNGVMEVTQRMNRLDAALTLLWIPG